MGIETTTVDVLHRYRDTFRPIYEVTCGDRDSFDSASEDFGIFMRSNGISGTDIMEMGPGRASAIFSNFLTQGGGCHADSPAGQARQMAQDIKAAKDPFERLTGLFKFVDLYVTRIENLAQLESATNGNAPHQARLSMQRLASLTENILGHFWKELERQFLGGRKLITLSNLWNQMQKRFHPAEREIAYAQAAFVETIHHVVNAFLLGFNPDPRSAENGQRDLASFMSLYRRFQNPFHWIGWAYENRTFNNPHLTIQIEGQRPEIRAVNHHSIRRVVDLLVTSSALVAHEGSPVSISFSWDRDRNEIVITSTDLNKVPSFIWKNIAILMPEWDKAIIQPESGPMMISIPVILEGDTYVTGNTGGNGPGDSSTSSTPPASRPPTTTAEVRAAPARRVIGMSSLEIGMYADDPSATIRGRASAHNLFLLPYYRSVVPPMTGFHGMDLNSAAMFFGMPMMRPVRMY